MNKARHPARNALDANAHLLAVASKRFPTLCELVAINGVLQIPPREVEGALCFLCKTVVGQQLLVNSCWSTVVGQQLSAATASSLWLRVSELLRNRGPLNQALSSVELAELCATGISAKKARTLKELRGVYNARPDFFNHLETVGYEYLLSELTSIWGVGGWTVDMLAIFWLGSENILPESDASIRKALHILLDAKEREALDPAAFSPYRTYLSLHLWRGLDSGLLESSG